MSKITDARRRRIFKLSTERGLDNETLHAHVFMLTGKASLKDLSIKDSDLVIDSLKSGSKRVRGRITEKQRQYIEGLAKEIGWIDDNGKLDNKRLLSFIEIRFKVSTVEWLTEKKASEVIEALKAMKSRLNASKNES